jgi:ketopantoate reductase
LTDQVTHALFRGTLEEVEAVARGDGIELPEDCVEQAMATAEAVEPWGRGSMYHDLDHGRRLELEALNGERWCAADANTTSGHRLTSPSTPL